MNNRDDPPYIVNLLNPDANHNCYFIVGDPSHGPVERIGVVSAMLMAHSMVMRRAMSVQDTEHDERWDISITDIQPYVFKNVLKFTYGYNNIKSYSILESLELLKVADRLVMQPLLIETVKHIMNSLSPSTVCLALSHPVVLNISRLEHHIAKMIRNNSKAVLDSKTLHYLCPAGMKYIVQLDCLQVSWAEVWRSVMKWARTKVLKHNLPSDPIILESFIQSRLITPSKEHSVNCCLTAIKLVEEAMLGSSTSAALLSNYHLVPTNQPQRLFICTGSRDIYTVKHEEMEVKTIQDCSFWAEPILRTSSELCVYTGNACVELHSIICSGKRKGKEEKSVHRLMKEDILAWYQCSGSVTIFFSSTKGEKRIANIAIMEEVTFNEDFQISLLSTSENVNLLPNSKYRIKTTFSKSHPLWYSNTDFLRPKSFSDLDVRCGLVNKAKLWNGSHVKYVMYRTVTK